MQLFKSRKNQNPPGGSDIGLLGHDTRFEGTIRFSGTLRIDGVVVGDIHSEPGSGSMLVVHQSATVTGNIVSDSVLISGRVEGNITALERVDIFRSGTLKGDVRTGDIMIEGGADFEGYCHMNEQARNTGPNLAADSGANGERRSPPVPPEGPKGQASPG